jgi:hypothetical protein
MPAAMAKLIAGVRPTWDDRVVNAPNPPVVPPTALGAPRRAIRIVGDIAEGFPLVGSVFGSARRIATEVTDSAAQVTAELTRELLGALVRRVVQTLVEQVDLTALVADNVDIDAIVRTVDLDAAVARVDLNRAVARVDLNSAVHRVDLIALANEIIDGVDLPGLVREASTSVSADVIEDVRSSGERADDAVAAVVDRLLRRNRRAVPGV